MNVSKLEIKLFEFCCPGKAVSGMGFYRRADFLVNGKPFSHEFSRLKENPLAVSTPLDRNPPPPQVIEQFYGVPDESMASGRFVLYDVKDVAGEVSGAISCVIERDRNHIVWRDICSEGLAEEVVWPDLLFDFEDYQAELKDYMERTPVTTS